MKRISLVSVLLLTAAADARADGAVESSATMTALQDELARASSMQLSGMQKPYYAAAAATEDEYLHVTALQGSIVSDTADKQRGLDTWVRVGDYANDSGRFEGDSPWMRWRESKQQTSLEDRYDPIRHDAWLSFDSSYKVALDDFAKKTAVRAGQQTPREHVDDFSREPPTVMIDAKAPKALDHAGVTKLARALSAVTLSSPSLESANVTVQETTTRKYFVSSEGARVVQPSFSASLRTTLHARADDGMMLSTFRAIATCSGDTIPSDESLVAEARLAAKELEEIRVAPVVEDYSGPVLFEGIAASQLLYNELASSLSGTPPEVSAESSFRNAPDSLLAGQVGQRVLPAGFRLVDDPTIDRLGPLPLAGGYKVDDEGVPAQKVTLVDDGIFKAFLMSRAPRKDFAHSNGHGRDTRDGIAGAIGNLQLTSARALATKDLHARLIAEAKAQKKPHAIIVERLAERRAYDPDSSMMEMITSFREHGTKVLVMWKLGLDGKLTRVRGGSLREIPIRALKDIVAAGNAPAVYSYGGGPGGYSIVSPALLLKDVEVKKPSDPPRRPPVIPAPR